MNSTSDDSEKVEQDVVVPINAADSFRFFTENMNSWWPNEYTWSGSKLEKIGIEPGENGHCFEQGPFGFRCDWGRVIEWNPPHKIVFTWQISPDRVPEPDPEKASEVEVSFIEKNKTETLVKLEHQKFSNHGDEAQKYKEALNSPGGWPYILNKFKEAAADNN